MRRLLLSMVALLTLIAGARPTMAQELEYLTSAYWTGAGGIEVVDNLAYCACVNGLAILDVSKPEAPALVSRVYCVGNGRDVDVWNGHAFLVGEETGLHVIDVSDPCRPLLVGHYETPGRAVAVAVVDGYAYIADGPGNNCGLLILDVSKPAYPHFAGRYVSAGGFEGVTIAGRYAYLGHVFYGLEIVDVSDPHHPTLAAFYSMCSSDEVFVDGDRAYVTGGCGGSRDWPDEYSILDILDVSDPTQPAPLGEYIYYSGYGGGPVAVHDDHAFVYYHDEGGVSRVGAIDVSDPAQPAWAGDVATEGDLHDLQIRGDVLYGAMISGGFQTFDVSEPAAPAVIGTWCEARGPSGIAGRDGQGYLADGHGGLRVLDLSDPLAPRTVAQLLLPGHPDDVRLAGDRAYLVDFLQALDLVDVTDPSQPVLLSRIVDGVRAAVVRGDLAYIAVGPDGLRIYDLADPEQPYLTGQCDLTGYTWDLAVAGDFAYVCTSSEGLQVVDISDPTRPVLRGVVCPENEYMRSLALVGSCVYVPVNNQQLEVFDVSDPDHPTHVLTYRMNCLADICATGNRLYLNTFDAQFMYGVTVLDVTEPLAPVVVGDLRIPGGCRDVLVEEPYLFVAAGGSLTVLGQEGAGVAEPFGDLDRLGLAVGNPVPAVADIRFDLPVAGPARVDLLDVAGRHVATLHDAFTAAGPSRLTWDWRSAGLTSGTYFVRLRAGAREGSRTVTLLR